LIDPVLAQYRETIVVLQIERPDDTRCPSLWVDQDISLLRGLLQGWLKKMGSTWLTRSLPLDQRTLGPEYRSHPEGCSAGESPAAIMATFAIASFRADRNAARVRLPLCTRNRASMNAHDRLIARAPRPVSDRGSGGGGARAMNFCHAVQSVARPGFIRRV
jgi:hypothetical protein